MECPNESPLPAVTPLDIEFFVERIDNIKSEVDEYFDGRSLPAEDPPLIEADPPDDAGAKLPAGRICRRCETSNPPGGEYCNKCGLSLAGCPNCGHVLAEGMTFCTKCGTKLD